MKDYTIVADFSTSNLEIRVNMYLNDGYVLVGGVCVHVNPDSNVIRYYFCQAVAKPISGDVCV
jgi:hypothetical protein